MLYKTFVMKILDLKDQEGSKRLRGRVKKVKKGSKANKNTMWRLLNIKH